MVRDTATKYRMGLYDTFRDLVKQLFLQKQNLTAKLDSQIMFLQSLQKTELDNCIDGLRAYKNRIEVQKDKHDLLRLEGGAGQLYFRNYAGLFDVKYGFNSRNGGGIKSGNRYASDVINALLNMAIPYLLLKLQSLYMVAG